PLQEMRWKRAHRAQPNNGWEQPCFRRARINRLAPAWLAMETSSIKAASAQSIAPDPTFPASSAAAHAFRLGSAAPSMILLRLASRHDDRRLACQSRRRRRSRSSGANSVPGRLSAGSGGPPSAGFEGTSQYLRKISKLTDLR